MKVSNFKALLVTILFCVTFIFTLLPISLRRAAIDPRHAHRRTYMIVFSLLSCYGGGIFLATCLLDLVPDSEEQVRKGIADLEIRTEFPIAQFMIVFGFLLILFSEQIGVWFRERKQFSYTVTSNNVADGTPSSVRKKSWPRGSVDEDSATVTVQSSMSCPNEFTGVPPDVLEAIQSVNELNRRGSFRNHEESHPPGVGASQEAPVWSTNGEHPRSRIDVTLPSDTASDVPFVEVNRPNRVGSGVGRTPEDDTLSMHFEPEHHSTMRAILLVLALSLHSFFEGMALGLQTSQDDALQVFIALLLHKSVIGFSLGVRLVQSQLTIKAVILCCALFSMMTPIGAGIGIVLDVLVQEGYGSIVGGLLQGVACGTFVYITFFEILPHELNPKGFRLLKLLVMVFGVVTIVLFLYFLP